MEGENVGDVKWDVRYSKISGRLGLELQSICVAN